MVKQIAICTVLFTGTVLLAGCPGEMQVHPGDWIFTIYDNHGAELLVGGVRLDDDGTAHPQYVNGETPLGAESWWQFGETFTLQQKFGTVRAWHTAKVVSEIYLEGDNRDPDTGEAYGTFIAYRLEDE